MTRELDRAYSDSASGPLYQHRSPRYCSRDMHSAMGRDAGYPQTSALIRRHILRQRSNMIERDHRKLRGRSEWSIRLGAVAPYSPPDPLGRYALADLIDSPSAIAVRNDARIWHANAERILTLLDIARIYARRRDPNA